MQYVPKLTVALLPAYHFYRALNQQWGAYHGRSIQCSLHKRSWDTGAANTLLEKGRQLLKKTEKAKFMLPLAKGLMKHNINEVVCTRCVLTEVTFKK